jgi:replicative DNA helicase
MLGLDEVARDISSKVNKNIKQLYSAEGKLKDDELSQINTALESIKDYPIYVVDNIGTVKNIYDTILYYLSSKRLIEQKRGLVVAIDNASLVLADDTGEKETIDKLMHTLVLIKKYISSIGGKIIIIVISQLNRQLESNERVLNPKLHYPNKSDLFGASSVYNSSDYVIIIHRPCLIEGLGNWYGPARKNWDRGLPVFNPRNPSQPMTYLHIIKERFGSNTIIPMLDDLGNSRIIDYNL